MSNLEEKRPGEPPGESNEAKRLKVFNEKMALVGFGEGQTGFQQNNPRSSREFIQGPRRYNGKGRRNSQGPPFAPIQNTHFQPPVQASFGQPQWPTWNSGVPTPSTNTFTSYGPDLGHNHAQPGVDGRLEDRSLRDIILSVLQETQPPQQIQQPQEAQLIRQPVSTQASTEAYPAASQSGEHAVNTPHTIRKGEPPAFVERLHLKIKTEVSAAGKTIQCINAVNRSHDLPSNILSPVDGFAEGTYIGVISDTNRNAIIAATEMALTECTLPTKQAWFLIGPAVKNLKTHKYGRVLLRSSEDPEDEEKHLNRWAARIKYEESVQLRSMRERIATLEMENQQLDERNRQLDERNQQLDGRNQQLDERNQQLHGRNQQLHERNQQLHERNQQLQERNQQLEEDTQELKGEPL